MVYTYIVISQKLLASPLHITERSNHWNQFNFCESQFYFLRFHVRSRYSALVSDSITIYLRRVATTRVHRFTHQLALQGDCMAVLSKLKPFWQELGFRWNVSIYSLLIRTSCKILIYFLLICSLIATYCQNQ